MTIEPSGTVEPTEAPPVEPTEPVVLSKEQEEENRLKRQRNEEEAKHRIFRREWKRKMAELGTAAPTADQIEAVKAEMKAAGLVGTEEGSEETAGKQAAFIANSNARLNADRERKANDIKRTAANETLAGTLEELGYKKGTPEYQMLGQALFNRHGIENPDLYADKELVEREREALAAALQRKTGTPDPVTGAVIARAGAPKPAAESRHPPAAGITAEVKAYAKDRGISEEAAKRQMELLKKQPVFGKRSR